MPTYVYKCSNEHYVDIIRSIKDEEQLPTCPACQNLMKRIYTAPPTQFNGKGFYTTDKGDKK